jgi:hypothetical protein
MILSERHKFVFIKGMKVAGTSVEMALATLCGPDDIVTPISPIDEQARGGLCRNYSNDKLGEADYLRRLSVAKPEDLVDFSGPPLVYYNHMALAEVMQRYPQPLTGFRVVCVERSPYAKVISWANMRLTYGNYRVGGEMRADPEALKAYVDRAFETGAIRDCRNIDRYRTPDGQLAARPMRYANLQADFAAFVRSLGMTDVPQLPHAKKGLMSDGLNPRELLRADQIARINVAFAEEFDAFGYPRL